MQPVVGVFLKNEQVCSCVQNKLLGTKFWLCLFQLYMKQVWCRKIAAFLSWAMAFMPRLIAPLGSALKCSFSNTKKYQPIYKRQVGASTRNFRVWTRTTPESARVWHLQISGPIRRQKDFSDSPLWPKSPPRQRIGSPQHLCCLVRLF